MVLNMSYAQAAVLAVQREMEADPPRGGDG